MKILIATSSFKDVYTSIEACEMIKNMLSVRHEIIVAPVCDGGEYTYDILNSYFTCKREYAEDVINPYGKIVRVPYLALNKEAFVISSEVLRLHPSEDAYKNPLLLTDYGLGQVLQDAVDKGYRVINLCLGGTSTIGFGVGTAQALGVRFYDYNGKRLQKPLVPSDYLSIEKMDFEPNAFPGIYLRVINDGITRACDLSTVNPLKIGRMFVEQTELILNKIDESLQKVLEITGLHAEDAYSGNGGGIYFGIEPLFETEYCKGAKYFSDLFQIRDKIQDCELVVTGEGRFDNPHLKKIPIVITELARECGKKVIYVCGQADKQEARNQENLDRIGIDVLISCADSYLSKKQDQTDQGEIEYYRENTPLILKEEFSKIGLIE